MLVGPPLDHWHTEYLNAVFADIGKVLLWERDQDHKGRILAKIRVTDLVDIPKSVRFTIGDLVESESWTFSVEVLQSDLLGGGHLMRTHFRLTMRTHIPYLSLGPRSPLLHLPLLLLGVKLVVGVSGWLQYRILLLVGITMKVGTLGKLLLLLSKVL